MKCPKCGCEMTMGCAHEEGWAGQWECDNCGNVIGVPIQVIEFPFNNPY
jgi:transcription initiation factor TFIIIB Brf1 subunit/transcription initiation factor TFIIB